MSQPEQPTEVIAPDPGVLVPETRSRGWREWFFGKPRSKDDLVDDPALLFQAVHLSGGASVIAHWLTTRKEPISVEEAASMGNLLAERCSFFYEDAKPTRR